MKYNSNDWDDLMKSALDGDKNAYRHLLYDIRKWLFAYFSKKVHPNAIEDLIQETLLAIHNKKHTWDINRPFGPWLHAVAKHKWIDNLRKNIKFLETELNEDIRASEVELCAKHDVNKLLKLIEPNQAKIINMVKLQEMSIEEVALQTGKTPSYVKIAVHRGLKSLQSKIMGVQND